MSAEIQLLLWVLGTFAIGCIGLIAANSASRGRGSLSDTTIGGITAEVSQFVFYIGLPFAAVITGALSLDLLGLGMSWTDGRHIAGFTVDEWARGAVIAAAVAVFVLLTLRWSSRGTAADTNQHEGTFASIRNAFYEQTHWAFYRAPFILLLNDALFGVMVGTGLIALEWLAHAVIHRNAARSPARWWVMVCCVLAGGLLFLLTQNLWLMFATDLVIRIGSERMLIANETKNLTG